METLNATRLKKWLEIHEIAKSTWYVWGKQGKTPKTWKLGKHRMINIDVGEAWLAELAAGAQ